MRELFSRLTCAVSRWIIRFELPTRSYQNLPQPTSGYREPTGHLPWPVGLKRFSRLRGGGRRALVVFSLSALGGELEQIQAVFLKLKRALLAVVLVIAGIDGRHWERVKEGSGGVAVFRIRTGRGVALLFEHINFIVLANANGIVFAAKGAAGIVAQLLVVVNLAV